MENSKTLMKMLFGREISVRLAQDGSSVVCTVKYGKFFSRTHKVALNSEPAQEPAEAKALTHRKVDKGLGE
jgi:hypothetical protein